MIEHEQISTNLQYTKTSMASLKSTNMSSAFSDLTPGQTVKKVVTRTEMRTVRTLDGKVVEDTYDPGSTQTTVERYTFDNRAVNGNAPRTITKQYVPGDEYRSGRRGPGSHSSVEDYRTPYSPGSQSGYASGEGRRTPTPSNPGSVSDGYQTPTGKKLLDN